MNRKALGLLTLAGCAAALGTAPGAWSAPAKSDSVDPHANETKVQRDARMHWWREARFGMFIHWGLYAVPAGTYQGKQIGGIGEWIMNSGKIPVATYAEYAKQFNPTQFNADEWVAIAKGAGMKYIVMTSKHHDGFAMFHSLADPYNIYDATPFKRDPIGEMSAACKKAGLKFGVYYSQAQDWHHPGGGAYGGHWDKAQDGDLDEYVKKVAAPQVTELLTRYRPAILWWDTPVGMTPEDIRLLTASFSAVPGLIANNRLGNGVPGDTETPEQFVPATGYKGDWETCMTINDTWGYKSYDHNFKPAQTLIQNLIDIASKGGNYLLNVGPEPTGLIPAEEVALLGQVGAWMKINHEAIYSTGPSPYRRLPFSGRATTRGNTLYLHVFAWPEGGLTLTGLETEVKSASALADHQKLSVTRGADGTLSISKPDMIDPVATVVVLQLAGPPVVHEAVQAIAPDATGKFALKAGEAELEGDNIKLEGGGSEQNIGYWTHQEDAAHWILAARNPGGKYTVAIDYAVDASAAGSKIKFQLDGKDTGLTATLDSTGAWTEYKTLTFDGTLEMAPGTHKLRIAASAMPGQGVVNLRRVTLIPSP